MAQFDVHANTGRHHEVIPYVVIVQSSQFDHYHRRVVVPLVRSSAVGSLEFDAFNPRFKIRRTSVVLHPLEMVSIPVPALGARVGSLKGHGDRIIRALDELFSRA
jgi:toxin CcdB